MERGLPFLHFRHSFDFRQEVMCQWAGDGRQPADAGGRNGKKKDFATMFLLISAIHKKHKKYTKYNKYMSKIHTA